MSRVSRIGHRGSAGHAPENTLAAVQKGIALGVDFVEIDVRRTADGALVALHDATINRTTDGRGRVGTLSLAQLKAFDAGNGERIPTVEEVLTIAAGRTGLMAELKVAGVARLIVEAVQKAKFKNPVIYASFLHRELAEVRAIAPDSSLMVLFDKLPKAPVSYAMAYRPAYVGLRHDRASRSLVEAFHQERVLVWVYTANLRADIRCALSAGVDGVISDFPERIPNQ
ncbi:MAG TPA: glycerophosphodiester phosphodiesterase family protein [Nitrospira sp.]|jgi:glycerophosphoryl diester phosphodiesterase|nr:glycerophosphodiester phosphodiesterase family protein [Nitrospira sp.]